MDAVSIDYVGMLFRSITQSVGIMLDIDKHTYVIVSNKQGSFPKQLSAGQSVEKKPVPVSRSALLRADVQ